jgi:PAS domain S-box-containing protein
VIARILAVACVGAASCVAAISAAVAASPEKIVLQLRWDHQFQFAGYYAALWQGYYAAAGLDVEIRPAFQPDGSFRDPIAEVASGRADFGTAGADILEAVDGGAPLMIVASVFQQSPVAFYAKAETRVSSLLDLTVLRVGARPKGIASVELRAMLREEGIDPGLVPLNPIEGDLGIEDLAAGRLDVAPGFTISAGWLAREYGLNLTALRPATYGVDFYGDAIFVNRRWIERDPELVRRFVAASLKGWQYALIQPEEVADRIARELPRTVPIRDAQAFNRFQIEPVRRLINFPVAELGNINPARWARMHAALKEAGLIAGSIAAADLIFDATRPARAPSDRWTTVILIALVVGLGAASLAWGWYAWRSRAERRRTTETLRASEQRLDTIAERIPGVVYRRILHPDGRVSYSEVSASGHERLALQAETVRDSSERFMEIIHRDDLPAWRCAIEESARNLTPFDMELRLRSKTGNYRWFHSMARPYRSDNGDIVWDGLALDVTDRKAAEERAREHKAELAHVLRLGTVEEMASAYAHEISQPLVAIYNYARGCSLRLESGRYSAADLTDVLARIAQQAERASKVVRNIGDFVRKGETELHEADLNAIVRTVAELAEVDFERGRVKLVLSLAESLPLVMVNRIEVEQVVLNLVRNAIEAMQDVAPADRILTIRTARRGDDEIEIVVSDTGPGLPAEAARVFEPFFTTKPGGLGMGLSISRTIIEAHGGRIEAEPAYGRGAEFTIALPIRQMAEANG